MKSENAGKLGGKGTNRRAGSPVLRSSAPRQSVILVADDDAGSRKLVTSLLEQDGHRVFSAADGREGLELSRQYPGSIELLIAGVRMPRLNGTDLCAHLLRERPGIKVLFISIVELKECVVRNVNLPVVTRPIDGQILITKPRALLGEPAQAPMLLRASGASS